MSMRLVQISDGGGKAPSMLSPPLLEATRGEVIVSPSRTQNTASEGCKLVHVVLLERTITTITDFGLRAKPPPKEGAGIKWGYLITILSFARAKEYECVNQYHKKETVRRK
jgi:hypothetical protein